MALLFEARSGLIANLGPDRSIVRTRFSQGTGAPTMRRVTRFIAVLAKSFMRQGRNEHFLGPQMFANVEFHNQAFSCISARRINVRAIGIL